LPQKMTLSKSPSRRSLPLLLFVITCLLILLPRGAAAKSWQGITPLHSTRADVERVLGKPVMDSDIYDAPMGEQSFNIRRACLRGGPTRSRKYSAGYGHRHLRLLEAGGEALQMQWLLIRIFADSRSAHSGNDLLRKQGGMVIRLTTVNGMVGTISYLVRQKLRGSSRAASTNTQLQFPANPNPMQVEPYPFDSYGKISFEDATARLDNFVIQLLELNKEKSEYRAFIIGLRRTLTYRSEAQSVADCAKELSRQSA